MNQLVEDYFEELLGAAGLTGDPDIYPGTCSQIREPDNAAILIVADSIENVIAGLHKASVKIVVSSPAEDREAHATLANSVKALLEGTLPEASTFAVGGWRTKMNLTQPTDEGRWLTSIEGILGLNLATV